MTELFVELTNYLTDFVPMDTEMLYTLSRGRQAGREASVIGEEAKARRLLCERPRVCHW